jgi:hypothetical protein
MHLYIDIYKYMHLYIYSIAGKGKFINILRDHIYQTFITVCCYNCPIYIAINLLTVTNF